MELAVFLTVRHTTQCLHPGWEENTEPAGMWACPHLGELWIWFPCGFLPFLVSTLPSPN